MTGIQPRAETLQKELDRIIGKIDKTDIRKIILFGFLVTGRVGLTSDIDLIIIRETGQRFLDRLESVYMEIEPKMAVDILVYTPAEINEMAQWSSFIKDVLKKGKALYAS
jgi:uncharacterized protein